MDIEYKFGFSGNPWGELEGVANRTDFDLSTHTKHSGVDLSFYDQVNDTRYVPYVIEPAAGLTRSFMAFLVDAYHEDEAPNAKGGVDKRTVLRLDPRLAPVKAAVLPEQRTAPAGDIAPGPLTVTSTPTLKPAHIELVKTIVVVPGNIPVTIIVRLQGTNAVEAKQLIDESGLKVYSAILLKEAAERVKEVLAL